MKKMIALGLAFVAAALVAACNQSSTSTPVAPQMASLSVASADARSDNSPVLLCHHAKGDDPAWIVITVDNGSVKYKGHLRHGDYTNGTCTGLNALAAGADCTCCATHTCVEH
jgi:hypothetical protein